MIKQSEFDFAYDYLRLDASWVFQWDIKNITPDTQFLYPFSEVGESKTWWFKGDAGATIKHDQFVWNPNQPYLEYDADNEVEWDADHPNNLTRYLAPGGSYVKLINTVESVIIDTIPPDYVSDKGTEYIVIQTDSTRSATRHCEFIFRDAAGLDFSNFTIKFGDRLGKQGQEVLLYACKRGLEYYDLNGNHVFGYDENNLCQEDDPSLWIKEGVNPYVNDDYIVRDSIKICSDGFHTYKIAFDLIDNNDEDGSLYDNDQWGAFTEEIISNIMNEYGLTIEIWDKAGNRNAYSFGYEENAYTYIDGYPITNQPCRKKWRLIDSLDDLTELQPCVIKFSDPQPGNKSVNENEEGSVWVSIYNPNVDFRCIDMDFRLSDTSVGRIDQTTVSRSRYYPDISDPYSERNEGLIKFKVVGIKSFGDVEVEAWLYSGNINFDEVIRNSTYAIEKCGPWLCIDAEGRKYNLKPYVPNYLKNSDYFEFIKFFELYLNTLYTNLTKGTNISILEKIAKIGDFNDMDRIEHCMIYHYARHYGAEYDMDLQTMLDLNLGFYAEGTLATRTEDDVLDIVKYALKNLPYYNKIKGTNNGMVMALKMFSLSCKIINLWCKKDPPVEKKADFLEEDRMYDFTSYFLTSRFNLEFNSLNIDFQSFNASLDVFIKFIKSIKPITRILNLIKYTVIFERNLFWNVNQYIVDDSDGMGALLYKIKWTNQTSSPNEIGFIDEIFSKTRVDWNAMHTERVWIPYNCDECKVEQWNNDADQYQTKSDQNPIDLNNVYTLLSHLVAYSHYKFIIGYCNHYLIDYEITDHEGNKTWTKGVNKTLKFNKTLDMNDLDFRMLDTGFYIIPHDGEASTNLAEIMKPTYFIDNYFTQLTRKLPAGSYISDYKIVDHPYMAMWIQHIPGTELTYCLYPELVDPN